MTNPLQTANCLLNCYQKPRSRWTEILAVFLTRGLVFQRLRDHIAQERALEHNQMIQDHQRGRYVSRRMMN
jgi:hypothetical protein